MSGPPIPLPPTVYDVKAFNRILQVIENRLNALSVGTPTVFTITAGSNSTSLDVSSATLGQVRAFLGTLVTEMQKAGKLGKP